LFKPTSVKAVTSVKKRVKITTKLKSAEKQVNNWIQIIYCLVLIVFMQANCLRGDQLLCEELQNYLHNVVDSEVEFMLGEEIIGRRFNGNSIKQSSFALYKGAYRSETGYLQVLSNSPVRILNNPLYPHTVGFTKNYYWELKAGHAKLVLSHRSRANLISTEIGLFSTGDVPIQRSIAVRGQIRSVQMALSLGIVDRPILEIQNKTDSLQIRDADGKIVSVRISQTNSQIIMHISDLKEVGIRKNIFVNANRLSDLKVPFEFRVESLLNGETLRGENYIVTKIVPEPKKCVYTPELFRFLNRDFTEITVYTNGSKYIISQKGEFLRNETSFKERGVERFEPRTAIALFLAFLLFGGVFAFVGAKSRAATKQQNSDQH
jgi:hypothetical protein